MKKPMIYRSQWTVFIGWPSVITLQYLLWEKFAVTSACTNSINAYSFYSGNTPHGRFIASEVAWETSSTWLESYKLFRLWSDSLFQECVMGLIFRRKSTIFTHHFIYYLLWSWFWSCGICLFPYAQFRSFCSLEFCFRIAHFPEPLLLWFPITCMVVLMLLRPYGICYAFITSGQWLELSLFYLLRKIFNRCFRI